MKKIDAILVALAATIFWGCTSLYPSLVVIDEEHFLVGGFDCSRYEHVDDRDFPSVKVVECYNSDDKFTGKRYSMSDEELQAYLEKRKEERIEILQDSPGAPSRPDPYIVACSQAREC
ncbi:MAG: hypothetical protein IIA07_09785 [Proteobacteria bacterium]|nr:hypothetical protein [Pseudomonadota bacterium]